MNSEDLVRRAEMVTPGGVHTSLRNLGFPLAIVRAEGGRFWDAEGREYFDFHGAFGPILLGHRHPEVEARVREALDRVDLMGTGITELEVEAAELIVKHVPSAEKVLFCNSGSEATFHAIRLARAVTGRPGLIKFQGCYHGHHDAVAMNVITPAERMGKKDPLSAGMMAEAIAETHVCRFNDIGDVERTVRENQGKIAAVILEPIPHNVGCIMPEGDFLIGLRALCDREGIVLIFDEVITGFRHHLGGYQAICGIIPDLTTMGKAMANGYPCAAIGGKAELMDRFNTRPGGDVFFAGTFNGHAASMAACVATIKALESGDVHKRLFKLGHMMRRGLEDIFKEWGIPAVVTGFGSVFLAYFMTGTARSYDDLLRNDAEAFVGTRREALKEGVFMLPMNLKRCAVCAVHTAEDIANALDAIHRAVKRYIKQR
jgi:glutamate-1-semialdehyde 2,1-aminomutase